MNARDRILARVRATRPRNAVAESSAPARRSSSSTAELPDLFFARAGRLGSDVARVRRLNDVPSAVAQYLDRHGLPRHAICWPDLLNLPWQAQQLAMETRPARGDDATGITGTFLAIAETGTLALLSGAATPAATSLVPETHVAIVRESQVVETMEDVWKQLREKVGGLPRAVNFVSGPSRTADVEQTVTLGAHGPRRVLIILVAAE